MTLAASTSNAARPPRLSASASSCGFGSVCSLGSQVEISSLAREKFGWRDSVVKASAQLRVSALGVEGLDGGGCAGMEGLLRVVGVVGAFRDMQHPPPLAPLPPQHPPPDGVPLADREAASVLQKRVLRGSAWHWAQVPGPLAHGLVAWVMDGKTTSERTSLSEGGGVN